MDNTIIFSIITVSYNSEKYIRETIESVANQTYPHIQYIIIDGASTDSSVDIINEYADKLFYWMSEKDNSMYEAINKGLQKATGDYVLILNSDDVLANNLVIGEVAKEISKNNSDGYYCNIIKRYSSAEISIKGFQVGFEQLLCSENSTFIPHPCLLVSKKILQFFPVYNVQYRYASDIDYILSILSKGFILKHLDIYLTKFRIHSDNITSSRKIDSEGKIILKKYGLFQKNIIYRKVLYYYGWIKYKIINKFNTRIK